MKLDPRSHHKQKRRNIIQFWLLLLLMAGYCYALASWVLGANIALVILLVMLLLLSFNPLVSPALLLRIHGAQKLPWQMAPDLFRLTERLAKRAHLAHVPQLYYLPSSSMNAFTTGSGHNAVIALSAGLLQQLNFKQIIGVIAHEMSHIRHKDMRILGFVATFSELARTLALVGLIMLLLSLPSIVMGTITIGLIPLLLMVFTPMISALIELAIMRNREFDADISAAELLGDPRPLIEALAILDQQASSWERYFAIERPNRLFNTHPETKERIRRLAELEQRPLYHDAFGNVLNQIFDIEQHFPRPKKRRNIW